MPKSLRATSCHCNPEAVFSTLLSSNLCWRLCQRLAGSTSLTYNLPTTMCGAPSLAPAFYNILQAMTQDLTLTARTQKAVTDWQKWSHPSPVFFGPSRWVCQEQHSSFWAQELRGNVSHRLHRKVLVEDITSQRNIIHTMMRLVTVPVKHFCSNLHSSGVSQRTCAR